MCLVGYAYWCSRCRAVYCLLTVVVGLGFGLVQLLLVLVAVVLVLVAAAVRLVLMLLTAGTGGVDWQVWSILDAAF